MSLSASPRAAKLSWVADGATTIGEAFRHRRGSQAGSRRERPSDQSNAVRAVRPARSNKAEP
eukprot:2188614-Prorocentrum_lima.AAC.1